MRVPDQDLLLRVLSDFAATLARRYDISEVLFKLADRVTEILDLVGAGVSVKDEHGRLRPVTPANELTAELEGTEEARQEGPCVDAFHGGELVVARVADAVDRWPAWCEHALQRGVVNVAGVPLRADAEVLGAMNIYSGRDEPFTEAELQVAQLLGDMAAGYIIGASALEQSRRTAEQLQRALETRVMIEQAKGVLAGERDISVDEAFRLLRRHARDRGVPLHTVADAVVRLGLRP